MTTTQTINKTFLKEWKPFGQLNKKAERAILKHFNNKIYQFQPSHDKSKLTYFRPHTFEQVSNLLGLAYTSSGDYAGLWVCNGGYLLANDTHHFSGFVINEAGQVVAIADDENENEIFIVL